MRVRSWMSPSLEAKNASRIMKDLLYRSAVSFVDDAADQTAEVTFRIHNYTKSTAVNNGELQPLSVEAGLPDFVVAYDGSREPAKVEKDCYKKCARQ